MESEFVTSSKSGAGAGPDDERLASVTNGAANEAGEGAEEYLEEHDPMTEDGEKENATRHDSTAGESQVEDGEEYEETAEEEEEAEADGEAEAECEDIAEEEDDGEGDVEADEEAEAVAERKPSQLPKKRKDAAMLVAAAEAEDEKPANKGGRGRKANAVKLEKQRQLATTDEEQPTSTARAAANKENFVDEEQCRVCTAKDDLVSLFKKVDKLTVAEMVMTICPKVSIARKDFMPQFICNTCLDNVTIAIQLKSQCEQTEHELRKKLSRSKNKVRRPTGFVVIDAPVESDPATEDEEEQNDEEFKVSDETGLSMEDDSDDSDFESTKKRPVRGAGGKRGRRKSAATTTPAAKAPVKKRMGRPPTKRAAPDIAAARSSDDEQPIPIKKKQKKSSPEEKQTEFPCDECDQIFTRKLSLVLHKKSHSGRQPINCEVCGKQFKIQGAYRTHLERHKDETNRFECGKCEMVFNTRADLRYHLADEHKEEGVVFQCDKCKRSFVTEIRLKKHQEGHCPGFEAKQRKHDYESFAVGKDLFKAVAPLTTTYWSDSFSD